MTRVDLVEGLTPDDRLMPSSPRGTTAPTTPILDSGAATPVTEGPARLERPGLSGVEPEDLARWLEERGQPAYRARQVGDAIWGGLATSVGELRTLPVALREEIGRAFTVDT